MYEYVVYARRGNVLPELSYGKKIILALIFLYEAMRMELGLTYVGVLGVEDAGNFYFASWNKNKTRLSGARGRFECEALG